MISVVVNTLNEAKNIKRCLDSVKDWADEIVVVDMKSDDKTIEIVKRYTTKIYSHPRTGYVEPARNFAISKTSCDWIFILDADEEIPKSLVEKLKEITNQNQADFLEIPRKNMIFGKWMKASFWWPDYNVRFFKKDHVKWNDKIHSKPQALGMQVTLPAREEFAILHYNYDTITQFLERMNRYTNIQALELNNERVKFSWTDLVTKPLNEFLSRFFAKYGFEDGLHGLALSFLQAFSFLVVYLKLWELQKFPPQEIKLEEIQKISQKAGHEINYWFKQTTLSQNPLQKLLQKAKNKFV